MKALIGRMFCNWHEHQKGVESTGGDSAHVSGDAGTEGGSWVHIHRHHLDLDETSISFYL